jgi:hypothetical protein
VASGFYVNVGSNKIRHARGRPIMTDDGGEFLKSSGRTERAVWVGDAATLEPKLTKPTQLEYGFDSAVSPFTSSQSAA